MLIQARSLSVISIRSVMHTHVTKATDTKTELHLSMKTTGEALCHDHARFALTRPNGLAMDSKRTAKTVARLDALKEVLPGSHHTTGCSQRVLRECVTTKFKF